MEQLNRIEIRGNVGNVSIHKVGESSVAHFSVATNYAYKGRNGEAVIDTTWHNVTAWESKAVPDLGIIQKGFPIYVQGRIRSQKYTGSDGVERVSNEIIAATVEIVEDNLSVAMGR